MGVITVTPTYGRKLKSNAHIHALVTEGALGSQNEWVRRELIP
ncbi:transposase [Bacillus sp. V33-4]